MAEPVRPHAGTLRSPLVLLPAGVMNAGLLRLRPMSPGRRPGWKAFREILKFCAKQQGGFVRCVPASLPGSVGLQLLATSRLRPAELFPVPHCCAVSAFEIASI